MTHAVVFSCGTGVVPEDRKEENMSEFEITAVEQRTSPSGKAGVFAAVTGPRGERYELSKLHGETDWLFDSKFDANGRPDFVHGFGSRCCMKSIAIGELADALEHAVLVEFVKTEREHAGGVS